VTRFARLWSGARRSQADQQSNGLWSSVPLDQPCPAMGRAPAWPSVRAPFLRCSVLIRYLRNPVFSGPREAAPRNETFTHCGG
jgi:hypothetical protein